MMPVCILSRDFRQGAVQAERPRRRGWSATAIPFSSPARTDFADIGPLLERARPFAGVVINWRVSAHRVVSLSYYRCGIDAGMKEAAYPSA